MLCPLNWRNGFPAILALCCTSGLVGQSYLADPLRFWTHDSVYAGSEACGACHSEIYARQQSSNHAASLRPAHEVTEFTEGLPKSVADRASDSALTLSRPDDSVLRLTAAKGAARSMASLEWAFGSGLKGITPLGRTAAGTWIESRLTWYANLRGIDFTTGSSQYDPANAEESLGRELTPAEVAECFGCHTTGFDPSSGTPARNEMGILCERCHGPGLAHVRAATRRDSVNGTIFNPVRLGGFAQAQMCGACHGRPPQDNDFDALRLLEQTPHSVRFPSQRIVLSRCFNETFGELACTACHDPHGDVKDEAPTFDSTCLSCHDTDKRERASVCPTAAEDCASCHMPKERVMRHSMFSDHWIRVGRSD